MKNIKRYLAFALTLVMAITFALPAAFAEGGASDGTITITNATKGITYKAYKLFDVTYDDNGNVAYKVPADKKVEIDTDLFEVSTAAENGNYSFWKKTGVEDDAIIAWVKDNYSTFAGKEINGSAANDSTFVFTNLDPGYYYVTSSLGSVVTIDTAAPNQTIVDKNDSTPEGPDKLIVSEDTDAIDPGKSENDAAVGSTEGFEVTFNAVNWITENETTTQAKAWKFTDTPTGLAIDVDSVKVWVTDDGTEKEITSTITGKSVDATGKLAFTIPWVDDNNGNSLYQPKTAAANETQTALIPVRVTYNATITSAAATAIAPNEVDVKYTNSAGTDVEVGTDTTNTYTYKFKLHKVDENGQDLTGAKFELYKGSVNDANIVKFSAANGTYTVDPNGTITQIDLTAAASADIYGLDKVNYILHEAVVPNGYNQANDTTVSANSLVRVDQDIADNSGTTTVENRSGATMPSTGGIGTTIFYIVGGVMVAGAVIFLLTKRRASATE